MGGIQVALSDEKTFVGSGQAHCKSEDSLLVLSTELRDGNKAVEVSVHIKCPSI